MSNTDLVREVEEELRRERLEKLWQQYGAIILAVALAIIVGVAGYKGWLQWQSRQAATAGTAFDVAVRQASEGKAEEASKLFAGMAADAPGGYRVLARLRLAAEAATAGRSAEAVATYDAVAADGAVDEVLRGYAKIAAAALLVDKVDSTGMQNRLNNLDVADGPWRHSARELLAISALRAGALADARKHLTAILVDQAAPQGVRRRAELMMSLITADQAKAGG